MPRQGAGSRPLAGPRRPRLAACLLLAQAALSSGAYHGRRDDNEIRLLQWNPHWECAEWNEHECGRYAKESLWAELVGHSIDFANIVELGFADKDLPAGWRALRRKCGVDVIELMYLSHRWKASDGHGAFASGCMDHHDRPFIVQQFDDISASGGGRRIIVVAAHYPHSKDRRKLRDALASVAEATGVQGTILIADTNEDFSVSNDKVMRDINAPGNLWVSTDLHNTCCWNNGVNSFAQGNTYDRIIANFGRMASTTVLPLPVWGRTGEFHRAVRGVLLDAPAEASGDEVHLRALQDNISRKAPLRQLGSVARPAGAAPAEAPRSGDVEIRKLILSAQQREEAENLTKKLEKAQADLDQAHLSEKKALEGRKEAERLAKAAARNEREAERLNAVAADEVLVAASAAARAEQLRQEIQNNTEGKVVAESLATRLKEEEDLDSAHQGEARKTQEKATSLKNKAAELSASSDYMMKEAESREKAAKKEVEDAEATMRNAKTKSKGAQQQAEDDYNQAIAAKRKAIKDAAIAKATMKKAEEMNLKVERDRLKAAAKKKKAEKDEKEVRAMMEKLGSGDTQTQVLSAKAQKDMKEARADNAAANELALKAASVAREATAQMQKADLAMAAADKKFYFAEPLLDEDQKYMYRHPDSSAPRHNASDVSENASRLLAVRTQEPSRISASLGVAVFLLAAPLLACAATVISHAAGCSEGSKGSRVRPCDGDDSSTAASALLQVNAQPEDGSLATEEPPHAPRSDGGEAASDTATPRTVDQEDTLSV